MSDDILKWARDIVAAYEANDGTYTIKAGEVAKAYVALRASPSEAEGKDLIAYAARYSWLREERDEQQPVVTIATFSDWGQPWRDVPLWGDELDAAVDKAMASSSRSEGVDK